MTGPPGSVNNPSIQSAICLGVDPVATEHLSRSHRAHLLGCDRLGVGARRVPPLQPAAIGLLEAICKQSATQPRGTFLLDCQPGKATGVTIAMLGQELRGCHGRCGTGFGNECRDGQFLSHLELLVAMSVLWTRKGGVSIPLRPTQLYACPLTRSSVMFSTANVRITTLLSSPPCAPSCVSLSPSISLRSAGCPSIIYWVRPPRRKMTSR